MAAPMQKSDVDVNTLRDCMGEVIFERRAIRNSLEDASEADSAAACGWLISPGDRGLAESVA